MSNSLLNLRDFGTLYGDLKQIVFFQCYVIQNGPKRSLSGYYLKENGSFLGSKRSFLGSNRVEKQPNVPNFWAPPVKRTFA